MTREELQARDPTIQNFSPPVCQNDIYQPPLLRNQVLSPQPPIQIESKLKSSRTTLRLRDRDSGLSDSSLSDCGGD